MNKRVVDIIRESLIKSSYEGLYNPEIGCSCTLDNIAPCNKLNSKCKGYKTIIKQYWDNIILIL